MSGETGAEPFGWTIDSLKVHLIRQLEHQDAARVAAIDMIERVLNERDRRYEQRWLSQEDAVRLALVGVNKEMIERMRQVREETQAAMLASDKAISKAEDATERRFAATNAYREQLSEQAATFAQRREVDAITSALADKVFALTTRLDGSATRDELHQHAETAKAASNAESKASLTRYDSAITRLSTLAEDVVSLKVAVSRVAALEELVRAQKERLDKTEGNNAGGQAAWGWIAAAVSLIIGVIVVVNLFTAGAGR